MAQAPPSPRAAARQPRGALTRALQTRLRTHTRRPVRTPRPHTVLRGPGVESICSPCLASASAGPFALKSKGGSGVVARGQPGDVGRGEEPSRLYSRRWHVPEKRPQPPQSVSRRRHPPPAVAPGRSSSVGKQWPSHAGIVLRPRPGLCPCRHTDRLPCTRAEDPVTGTARRERAERYARGARGPGCHGRAAPVRAALGPTFCPCHLEFSGQCEPLTHHVLHRKKLRLTDVRPVEGHGAAGGPAQSLNSTGHARLRQPQGSPPAACLSI